MNYFGLKLGKVFRKLAALIVLYLHFLGVITPGAANSPYANYTTKPRL